MTKLSDEKIAQIKKSFERFRKNLSPQVKQAEAPKPEPKVEAPKTIVVNPVKSSPMADFKLPKKTK